eukprot:67620_1
MAAEDTLKEWLKAQNVWHPKLYNVLKSKNILTLQEFGKLKKKEYNDIVKESKFAKPSTLKSVYDAAKPTKKKRKKDDSNDDNKQDNDSKKKKKTKSKKAAKKRPGGKSVKEMMAEYAKQKPKGSGKTNDTISFAGGNKPDND